MPIMLFWGFFFLLVGLFRRTDGKFLSEYVFREQSHALTVLHGLNEQRKSNTLCDVIICVEGEKFPCHRNILAACSPYFLAMFTGDATMCDSCIKSYHKRSVFFFCKTEKKIFNLFIPLCMITPALKFNRKMHNSYFLKTVLFDIELSLFVYTCMPVLTIWARKHDVYLYLVGFYSKKIHNYMNRCTGTHDIYQWGTSLSLVIESQFSTDCDIVRVCFMHVNTNF